MIVRDKATHVTDVPLVSIVIPAYNSAPYLAACLESCLSQSYSNLEIIVVDDGSVDNTREVLRPFFNEIDYHYQDNAGLAGARNAGHNIARGKYIAWLDSDDLALPERISLQVQYMESSPETVLVCSDFSAFDNNGNEYPNYSNVYYSLLAGYGGVSDLLPEEVSLPGQSRQTVYVGGGRYQLIWGNFIHPPTVMFRRDACIKAGNLREDIPTQEDWEFFFRISQDGLIAWLDSPLVKYRLHPQQMSSTANAVKNATGIVRVFESMLAREQEYSHKNKTKVRHYLGRFCASAAYALLEDGNKSKAVQYLQKSFLCSPRSLVNYKLLVKMILS